MNVWLWVASGYAGGIVLALRLCYWLELESVRNHGTKFSNGAVVTWSLIWPVVVAIYVAYGIWLLATAGLPRPNKQDEVAPGRLYAQALTQAKLMGHDVAPAYLGLECNACGAHIVVNEASDRIWGEGLEVRCGEVRPAVEL